MREQLGPADTLGGYDRWAASYDVEPNALVAATSWVLDRAPLGCADADVLELGCGTGRNARRAIDEGARSYVGLDGSLGMLAVAQQRYHDKRISFGQVDLLAPWTMTQQFDYALIVLVLEHLPFLDALLVSLARAMKPGGRVRIVDLHPDRVIAGSFAHFDEGGHEIAFTSVAHAVPALCEALDMAGFDTVRRDWLATDTMIAEVPGIAKHRGTRLVLDLKATRRVRERRGSGAL
jgi:SAM-dependent methyltransferase